MAPDNSQALKVTYGYFPALTGLRAVAAYFVFITHSKAGKNILPDSIIDVLAITGLNCMTLFFMLSGFVITYRYSEDFQNPTFQFRKLYLNRFARIYPLVFLLLILNFILEKNYDLSQWVLNLTFLKGFFNSEKFTGIAATWSLTAEISFYLLAPWLLVYFKKFNIIPVLIISLTGIAIVTLSKVFGTVSFMNSFGFALEYTFFGLCFEFFCGYYLFHYYKIKITGLNKRITTFNFKNTFTGILAILVCLGLELYCEANIGPVIEDVSAVILINNYLLPIAFFFLFYGLMTERTIISRVLSSKIAQILGKSSFAFYLIHGGKFYEILYFHVSKSNLVIFLILNIAAVLLHKFVEEPINNFILGKEKKFRLVLK